MSGWMPEAVRELRRLFFCLLARRRQKSRDDWSLFSYTQNPERIGREEKKRKKRKFSLIFCLRFLSRTKILNQGGGMKIMTRLGCFH